MRFQMRCTWSHFHAPLWNCNGLNMIAKILAQRRGVPPHVLSSAEGNHANIDRGRTRGELGRRYTAGRRASGPEAYTLHGVGVAAKLALGAALDTRYALREKRLRTRALAPGDPILGKGSYPGVSFQLIFIKCSFKCRPPRRATSGTASLFVTHFNKTPPFVTGVVACRVPRQCLTPIAYRVSGRRRGPHKGRSVPRWARSAH